MAKTRKKSLSKYQKLIKAKASVCAGRGTVASLNKAAGEYVKDAVKKGNQTKAKAESIANRVKKLSCSAGIGGARKRKRKTAKKK